MNKAQHKEDKGPNEIASDRISMLHKAEKWIGMKKQDLRVSANKLRAVSGNSDISLSEQGLHGARGWRFVASVD